MKHSPYKYLKKIIQFRIIYENDIIKLYAHLSINLIITY